MRSHIGENGKKLLGQLLNATFFVKSQESLIQSLDLNVEKITKKILTKGRVFYFLQALRDLKEVFDWTYPSILLCSQTR